MAEFTYEVRSEADTQQLGESLAAVLPEGATVALCGTLGAGKTRLVKAIAPACGVDPADVISPTFVLCREYFGDRTLCHMDAYRIRDDDEFLALGAEEYFDRSEGITLVEWAEKVVDCLPPDRYEVQIEVTGHNSRQIRVASVGGADGQAVELLRAKLGE